jgi:DNA segregation ATPase FtsK/SpoIIIE-like protein
VKTLQQSNPRPISVVTTRLVSDAYRVEKDIHEFLQDRHVGEGREWFELTPSEALDMAIIINKNPEIDMTQQITVRTILAQQTARQQDLAAKLDLVIGRYMKLEAERAKAVKAREVAYDKPDRVTPEASEELLMEKAIEVFKQHDGKASTSLLQRTLNVGYGRAARCLDKLTAAGIVTAPEGNHARRLISEML